jgi:hypothetical protein
MTLELDLWEDRERKIQNNRRIINIRNWWAKLKAGEIYGYKPERNWKSFRQAQ